MPDTTTQDSILSREEAARLITGYRRHRVRQRLLNIIFAVGMLANFFALGWLSNSMEKQQENQHLVQQFSIVCTRTNLELLPEAERDTCIRMIGERNSGS